jgi:hypothetical protein
MTTGNGAVPLDQKIAEALGTTDPLTSEFLLALYNELDDAVGDADRTARECRARSVDPLCRDGIAERGKAEDQEFVAARLRAAATPLRARYQQAVAREERAAWETKTAPLEQELAAIAAEFAVEYPAAVAKLVDLFRRVELANQEAARANSGAPGYLHNIEERLRGVRAVMNDTTLPTLGGARNAWPTHNPGLAYAISVSSMLGVPGPRDGEIVFDEAQGCYVWRAKGDAPPSPPFDTRNFVERQRDDEARKAGETERLRAYYDDIAAAKMRNDKLAAAAEAAAAAERRRLGL